MKAKSGIGAKDALRSIKYSNYQRLHWNHVPIHPHPQDEDEAWPPEPSIPIRRVLIGQSTNKYSYQAPKFLKNANKGLS
jgi:hypothetical protein